MKKTLTTSFLFGPPPDYTSRKKMIQEAKDAEFMFKVFSNDDEINFHFNNIKLTEEDRFICQTENGDIEIRYLDINEIQSLPITKCINVLLINKKNNILLWKFFIPLIIGLIGFVCSSFIKDKQVAYFLKGLSVATFTTGYVIMFSSLGSMRREWNKLSKRAVGSSRTASLIKSLERASSEEDYFNRLINVNLSNMEEYYLLVKVQTKKSYNITLFASFVGFAILICGIILSYSSTDNTGKLTIWSGVITEFISTVFFYLYNRTVLQLNIYHDKLVAVQDTMLALRVAQSIKDDQSLKNLTMKYLTEILTNKLIKTPDAVKNQ